MSAGNRIIFVNRFYWPEEPATAQLLTDLTVALAGRGHSITVITSQPRGQVRPTREVFLGVEIYRTSGKTSQSNALTSKAISFLSFAFRARRLIAEILSPGDVLVLMTDPPLLNTLVTTLAIKRGARVVHWSQDIYPEVARAVGKGSFSALFTGRRDRSWMDADVSVVPGEDMARYVRSRGVAHDRVLVCPNWAPHGVAPEEGPAVETIRKSWGLVGKFVVMYSGNLGRVHDLDPLIDLADSLRNERDIVFLFVGGGAQKHRLQAAVRRRKLPNVLFKPSQPRLLLNQTLSLAHLHLITLKEGCESFVFPSKFYGIAAVGRPVLFVGPTASELARIISSRDLGRAYKRSEINSLAQTIRHLRHSPADCSRMGAASLAFAKQANGAETATELWDRLLNGLGALTPRSQNP